MTPKKKKRKRLVHYMEDSCIHCGVVDTSCDVELDESEENRYTTDPNKVTCPKCRRELKGILL
jgi:hypothetical protein